MNWLVDQTTVNIWWQNLGEWLVVPMKFFSFLGTEEFFMIFIPLLFWSVDTLLGVRVAVMLLFSNGLNHFLKISFHTPRPFWIDPQVKALAVETSFGMPSGHSQIAASLWGVAAVQLKRSWAWLAAILLVLLIGISRLYLGVHFLTDVLSGWLLGGLSLWGYVAIEPYILRWLKNMGVRQRISWAFLSTLIALLLMLTPHWLLAGWTIPDEWAANTISLLGAGEVLDPVNTETVFTIAGTWLGLSVGLAWMYSRHNGYTIEGTVTQKILRYILGVAGVLILRFGLKLIFPDEANFVGDVFRLLRYALIGSWISLFAPLIFKALRLTGQK